MRMENRERRDWSLLILIIPIGILLIVIVGNLAIYLLSNWSINRGMQSSLDPNSAAERPFSLLVPLLPQILTPPAWGGNYLTPSGDTSILPFFNLLPGAAPSPTPVPPVQTVIPPVTTAVPAATPTPFVPPPVPTTRTPDEPLPTNPPPSTEPPTEPPTKPPTEPPTEPPSPTPTGFPSTPDPTWAQVPPPSGFEVGSPDGVPGSIPQGRFVVVDLVSWGSIPIVVDGSDDYDLAFYESEYDRPGGNPLGFIYLDNVILGISKYSDGQIYYEVFNWGNLSGMLTDDTNTNIAHVIESDNVVIPLSELYNYPIPPSTGILINVDAAASAPPHDSYQYLIIVSPFKPATDSTQVDAIEIFP